MSRYTMPFCEVIVANNYDSDYSSGWVVVTQSVFCSALSLEAQKRRVADDPYSKWIEVVYESEREAVEAAHDICCRWQADERETARICREKAAEAETAGAWGDLTAWRESESEAESLAQAWGWLASRYLKMLT